jgi:hypothetical protein
MRERVIASSSAISPISRPAPEAEGNAALRERIYHLRRIEEPVLSIVAMNMARIDGRAYDPEKATSSFEAH